MWQSIIAFRRLKKAMDLTSEIAEDKDNFTRFYEVFGRCSKL
jgi:hypothetical protein